MAVISVSSPDDMVADRFGRGPYFLVIDPDTMGFEVLPNPNISLGAARIFSRPSLWLTETWLLH